MAETRCVQVRIEGRVQGVWFRAWTKGEATARGLSGWVRNCRDGSVEALFCGPGETVEDMIIACWQGPPAADVLSVVETPADPPGYADFKTLLTE